MDSTDDKVRNETVQGRLMYLAHRINLDHALVVSDVGAHNEEVDGQHERSDLEYVDFPALIPLYHLVSQVLPKDELVTEQHSNGLLDTFKEDGDYKVDHVDHTDYHVHCRHIVN